MEKYFVNYAQAVALKELGFNEKCYAYFTKHEEFFYFDVDDLSSAYTKNMDNLFVNSVDELECTAPLKAQVFEWFREKHGLWVSFTYDEDESEELYWYVDKILKYGIGRLFFHDLIEYNSYEEAESAAIDKLLEIIKEK